jgi:signal transduction histidine kinase
MTLFASLTNRIFIASAMLAVMTTGVAVYVVGVRATREAEAELARGLTEAGTLVEQQRRSLTTEYLLIARLLADLPKLKGAVETGDPPTIAPIAAEYQRQVGADVLIVTGRAGVPLTGALDVVPAPEAIARALAGHEVIEFRPDPRGVLQLATVPIAIGRDAPDVLGALSVGVLLDRQMADQFKGATRSEVAFALDGRIRAATLGRSHWSTLAGMLDARDMTQVTLGDAQYVGRSQPLAPRADDEAAALSPARVPVALVLRSRTEQLGFLRTVYWALGVAALAAVVLATGLSYAVARTVTRPLGAITTAMREVAATGDLTRKITLRGPAVWQDEDARLLAATFNTLTESIARFQREAGQKQRLLALGRLSTVIAHEVRNPLMIIRAALRSLGPDAAPADIGEAVHDIDGEVRRLDRIVNDVLDFARPLTFVTEPTDLVQLCRDTVSAATVDAAGPEVALELPEPDLTVTTDPERLRTALLNILSNARQAVQARAAAGSPATAQDEPAVRLSLDRIDGSHVRVRVVDRGTGILAGDLPQIFEPYFTTRRAGTGLGLPIARNIFEGLGGTLAVDTVAGRTTVDIVLPLYTSASA